METSFIPLFAIIAVLIIAFLLALLPQINHKNAIQSVFMQPAIIMLLAVILLVNIWLVAYKTQVTIICLS